MVGGLHFKIHSQENEKLHSVEDFGLGEINSNVKLTSFRHKECSQSQERTMKIWAVQQKTL